MFNTWRLWYRRRRCLKNMRNRRLISWINIIVMAAWFLYQPITKPHSNRHRPITKSNYCKISEKNSWIKPSYLISYHPHKITMTLYRVSSNSSPTIKSITIPQNCPQASVNSKNLPISSCFWFRSIIGLTEWVHFGRILVDNHFLRQCSDYWR